MKIIDGATPRPCGSVSVFKPVAFAVHLIIEKPLVALKE